MHDEYRAPMADGRRGGSRSGFEALENVPHPINILGVPASPVMDKITSAATVGAEVQATSLAMPAMPAMPATPETPATITDAKLTSHVFNNELIGIVQYPDLQVATPQTIKTVFFFAAFADSTAAMGAGAQEDHEDLQAEWVDFKIAGDRLRFSSEKEAVYKARQDMKRSGLEC
ncbi:hypothetical protein SBRCBS47491_006335 [Sporothrix bragantina]|uniref:Uncharacterized protein n=1 Tax=Sporothrix bragantina TaxID=671064 RepID=A0ABP0C4H0_9PEZI